MQHYKFVLFILIFTTACKVNKTLSNLNVAPIYNTENSLFNLQYSINHFHNDSSKLSIYFNPEKLLYIKQNNDSITKYNGQFTIKYSLYKDLDSEEIVDSLSIKKTIYQDSQLDTLHFILPCKLGENYWMIVKLTDLKRSFDNVKMFPVYKKYTHHSNFFHLPNSQKIQFGFTVKEIQNILIQHKTLKNTPIFVYPVIIQKQVPNPPFISKNKNKDDYHLLNPQTFWLNDSGQVTINLPYPAIFLKIDTTEKFGSLVYQQNYSFPEYTSIEKLIDPLVYLLKPDEFLNIKNANDIKTEFENFWLKHNQMDMEKARKAIKNYYDKITYANSLFTTYKDGWQTDKGMMYIIKGLPQSIRVYEDREIWYYGETSLSEPELYVFRKSNWEIYPDHYILDKNFDHKYSWEKNIQLIKEGRL
jgi:GWxTD domain-containing protein